MENKTEWYRKLLRKLNKIKSGELDLDAYIDEVKAKIEAEKPQLNIGAVSCRIINGCFDCPFNYEYDMAVGYGCKMDNENRSIRQSKKYQPITPDWCPIKNSSVVVKYGS